MICLGIYVKSGLWAFQVRIQLFVFQEYLCLSEIWLHELLCFLIMVHFLLFLFFLSILSLQSSIWLANVHHSNLKLQFHRCVSSSLVYEATDWSKRAVSTDEESYNLSDCYLLQTSLCWILCFAVPTVVLNLFIAVEFNTSSRYHLYLQVTAL